MSAYAQRALIVAFPRTPIYGGLGAMTVSTAAGKVLTGSGP